MDQAAVAEWDVFAVPAEDIDEYSLVHVVAIDERESRTRTVLVELDWSGPTVPSLADLQAAWPKALNPRLGQDDRLAVAVTGTTRPRHWVFIGNHPKHYGPSDHLVSFEQIARLSVARKLRTRPVPHRLEEAKAADQPYACRYWRLPDDPPKDALNPVRFGPTESIPWETPLGAHYRGRVIMHGPDHELQDRIPAEFRGSSLLGFEWLRHEQSTIDFSLLRQLSIVKVTFGEGLDSIALPEDLNSLILQRSGDQAPPEVVHPRQGRGMSLNIQDPAALTPLRGLDQLRRLSVSTGGADLDLTGLASLPNLETLRLRLDGGGCSNLNELARLERLRILRINEIYRFDPEQFPDLTSWPGLDTIEVRGLPQSAAKVLRKRLRAAHQLTISGARNDKWLAENIDNPLRHWVDRNEKIGTRATKAYVRARRRITVDEPEVVIRGFVAALNGLAADLPIETMERDDAWVATEMLAEHAGLPPSTAEDWFNQDRDF